MRSMRRCSDASAIQTIRAIFIRLATLIAVALPAAPAFAVNPAALTGYRLVVTDGLANNSVYCIEQDRQGFIWLGTFGGLSRYDGESFVTFRPSPDPASSIAASVVFDLIEDSRGFLWIATDGGGLSRFDPESGEFLTWRANAVPDSQGIASDRVLALAEDRTGAIWIGTDRGTLDLIDASGGMRRIGPGMTGLGTSPVRAIAADPAGGIWVGTEGGGIVFLGEDGSVIRRIRSAGQVSGQASSRASGGVPESLGSDVVRSLLVDSGNRLWIGLGNGGVDMLDTSSGRIIHAVLPESGPREAVRSIEEDSDGGIWVGFADSGIGYLDPVSGAFSPPSLRHGGVRAIMRDRSGLMWVGYKEGGVEVLNPRSALVKRYRQLRDGRFLRQLRGLANAPDGTLLLASDGLGVLDLDPESGLIKPHPGYPRDRQSAKAYALLAEKPDRIWIGTDGGGLIRMDGTSAKAYRHDVSDPASIASDVVWAIHRDPDGTIWIGTEGGGLDRYDAAGDSFVHYPSGGGADAIRGASVRTIFRDSRNRLWVGTWDGGVSVMDPVTGHFSHFFPADGQGAPSSGLLDSSINCMTEDTTGTIWIGTGGSGIARFDENRRTFVHFGEREGLAGSTVYGLVCDTDGDLWISTATGLTRRDRATAGFFTYGTSDGLVAAGLTQNSFLKDRSGNLWFGGQEGLSAFDPKTVRFDDPPPQVAISTIMIPDGSSARYAGHPPILGARPLDLPYLNAGIQFSLAVLDYRSPTRHRYRILLEGSDPEWTDLAKGNTGYLARLGPGRHVLKARGANGYGVWSRSGAALEVHVRPPFWGTWLFRGIVLALVAFSVFVVVRVRTDSLRKRNDLLMKLSHHVEAAREEERISAARDVHDEIGQHLAAINLQAWWLDSHPRAPIAQRKERIEEMKGSVSGAMAAVKHIATSLRPIALDALTFPEALRWYLQTFERRSGIAASLSLAGTLPAISDEVATALFRISQELLTNVIRHAGAGSVTVSLTTSPEEDRIIFVVRDDGKGIDHKMIEADDSFGLIGIRERCAAYGGLFSISGAPDRGTIAQVVFPLSNITLAAAATATDTGKPGWIRNLIAAVRGRST